MHSKQILEFCQNLGTQPFILSQCKHGLIQSNDIKTIQADVSTKSWENQDFLRQSVPNN